jgi:hypothetical protein
VFCVIHQARRAAGSITAHLVETQGQQAGCTHSCFAAST